MPRPGVGGADYRLVRTRAQAHQCVLHAGRLKGDERVVRVAAWARQSFPTWWLHDSPQPIEMVGLRAPRRTRLEPAFVATIVSSKPRQSISRRALCCARQPRGVAASGSGAPPVARTCRTSATMPTCGAAWASAISSSTGSSLFPHRPVRYLRHRFQCVEGPRAHQSRRL